MAQVASPAKVPGGCFRLKGCMDIPQTEWSFSSARMGIRPVLREDAGSLARLYSQEDYQTHVRGDDADKDAQTAFALPEFGMLILREGGGSDGRFIGNVTLAANPFDGTRRIEITYGIVTEQQDQRYASEAVRAVSKHFRKLLPTTPLIARVDPNNLRSVRALVGAGFIFERKREFGNDDVYVLAT